MSYTAKITCKDFVGDFAINLNNRDEWREDYPDGTSVKDILDNDTTLAFIDEEDWNIINEYSDEYILIDPENIDTKYKV
jgi:hypothetical protein